MSRAAASMVPMSAARIPKGTQPSPSSTARRSERAVRPPIHSGTEDWRAQGSITTSAYR